MSDVFGRNGVVAYAAYLHAASRSPCRNAASVPCTQLDSSVMMHQRVRQMIEACITCLPFCISAAGTHISSRSFTFQNGKAVELARYILSCVPRKRFWENSRGGCLRSEPRSAVVFGKIVQLSLQSKCRNNDQLSN